MTKNKKRRRVFPNATIKQLQRIVSVIGYDGAWVMFNGVEEGKSAEAVMRDLEPFFDRYAAAYKEEKGEV